MSGKSAAHLEHLINFDPNVVAEIVHRTRAAQGLAPQVESAVVMAKLAVLVSAVLVQK